MLLVGCGSESDASGEPSTTWNVEGPLLAWQEALWVVDATPIVVPSELGMDERRWLGAMVTASGSFDETGQRVAERVSVVEGELPSSTLPAATVSGPIEETDDERWIISGRDVMVPTGTHIDGGTGSDAESLAQPGTTVTVEGYQLADGRVLAVNIMLRQDTTTDQVEQTDEAAPEPAVDSIPTTLPELTPEPAIDAPTVETPVGTVEDVPVEEAADGDDGSDNGDSGKPDDDDKDNDDKEKGKPEKPDNGSGTDKDD